MHCPKCGADNRAGKKFCSECGVGLLGPCPQCGVQNSPAAKFCGECGAALSTPTDAPVSEPPTETRQVAERRHLTILFCDLVGSTTLAAQLDPEAWRATVAGYQRTASEAITRFGGVVMRYVGDGIMAFFGYPVAHDNDAERAARAGLTILDAIGQLNGQPRHVQLAVRIGIDSGRVVVGEGAGKQVDAFGDAANIAARVQSVAAPNSVVLTGETQRLIAGLFIVEELEVSTLRGIERPVQLYRAVRPSGVRGRFEAAAAAGALTPFVGREDELRSLLNRWERARGGEGQVVTIIGEAGIGKSRLVRHFQQAIAGIPHTWLEASAGAFFQNTPFHAVSELLRQILGDSLGQEPLVQLEGRLIATGLKPAEAIPLLAPLLNLPESTKYAPSALAPEHQRRRLMATLVDGLLGSARTQPLVSVIEDLHWADPSTLELIQLLVEQVATAPLLLIYTARPEFHPAWPLRAHHTLLALNGLNARDARAMVAEVDASKALSDTTIATVVERTGGVPLFVEELTRAVLENVDRRLTPGAIPVTLHDSLMARLDRLGPAKEVIQIGAALGSDFSYELLHAVHAIADADLQRALRSLTDAELLFVRGIAPEAKYQFKHALIRDAAYEALLKSRRKELHLIVARTIDEQFPAIKETQPEVLARHWTEAGEIEPALAAWQKAAEQAVEQRAYREAEQHYGETLRVLRTLPESPERDARELDFASALVQVLQITKGYSAAETVAAAAQARVLAQKSGNTAQLELQQVRTWNAVFVSGDYVGASILADQILELAGREGRRRLDIAHHFQIQTRFYRGDLVEAEEHFTRLSDFLDGPDARLVPGASVITIGATGLGMWILGYPDVGRERTARAIAFAESTHNPYDMAFGLLFVSYLHRFQRQPQPAQAASAQMLALCERHGFSWGCDLARGVMGWALAELGNQGEGVSMLRLALAGQIKVGSKVGISDVLTRLAEAQARANATADALSTIEEALQVNPQEIVFRPNVITWRGRLRLKLGQTDLAEADFNEAIAMARKMSAKSWEMRATTSLCHLLRDLGRRDEARAMLAATYNSFTEGFETIDLKDAKALLNEFCQ